MIDPRFVTIGAYGWDAAAFFAALTQAGVDTFCDLRARRGVRGSAYAWANSQRLQARLAELGIRYLHRPDLAPSAETRAAQHAADAATKTAKRQRAVLSPDFVAAYRRERLTDFDSAAFIASLGAETGAQAGARRGSLPSSAWNPSRRPATARCSPTGWPPISASR